ncbi:antitoxin [Streptomyces sp. UNOB3_S3]|uniref:antitoxin n=1 Tax=Streptomyces sp. UNOB3_S3 TaxID=2871682 RepID=UPI001E47ADBC|nr:antitoxin [Streptomyces sp. UNOB3_S3]MCC3779379.1 antitoxin [Streptomyces sp. UNOB3_S3]
MSFIDTLKGLVGKGRNAAAENPEKFGQAVDKAGSFIDEKTGHEHSDKIEKGKEAAKTAIPLESEPEPSPPAPEPPAEPRG